MGSDWWATAPLGVSEAAWVRMGCCHGAQWGDLCVIGCPDDSTRHPAVYHLDSLLKPEAPPLPFLSLPINPPFDSSGHWFLTPIAT